MKKLKKSVLTEEAVHGLTVVNLELAQMAFKTNPRFLFETFEEVRRKEEWEAEEVEFMVTLLGQIAFFYSPSATKALLETQAQVAKTLNGFMEAVNEGVAGKSWEVAGTQYVRLSEKSLQWLRQVYPDLYLKRHKNPKAQEVLDALPHIQESKEVMGWFVARIVNASGGHKKLRQALEADLAVAGLRLIESEKSYGIISAKMSQAEEAEISAEVDEHLKKRGQS